MVFGENKCFVVDIIFVLVMIMSGEWECFKYWFVGFQEELVLWGYEYVRYLVGEVVKEWQELDDVEKVQWELLFILVKEIVFYNMVYNVEYEVCDLFMEIEQVDMLEKDIDENVYVKVCFYFISCVNYVLEFENFVFLCCVLGVF